MATDQSSIWQSKESVGSNESLASNAAIPLPVPVRTRSARGGSESGYSSDTYNAMTIRSQYAACNISMSEHYDDDIFPIILCLLSLNLLSRRLERDTSVDRLSTGSRESMQSTQSEWLPGEKKKSKVGCSTTVFHIPSLHSVPGSAWEAEECSEEGQEHLRGARVWERERHQLCECAEQAEYEQQDEHGQQTHTAGEVKINSV